jgi:antitoxin component of MazEF toxin-antitoxin module
MTASFTKLGNEYAFILDESQFQELSLDLQSQFDVKAENGKLVLTPIKPNSAVKSSSEDKFEECLTDLHARFGRAMKKLAE